MFGYSGGGLTGMVFRRRGQTVSLFVPAGRRSAGAWVEGQARFADEGWPAWIVSLGVHTLLLLVLWCIKPAAEPMADLLAGGIFQSVDSTPLEPDKYKFDTVVADQVGNDAQINTFDPNAGTSSDAAQASV